ncbi:PAS domain S-box-containing protein [Algoriphagus locisalis]|uniref:histidine kinase n=1 Tax=Algoriphagus locisalis TaxID=305507 RepID=A0A1I7DRE5_9BACT|nr:ATP-binding protein [Algoriphagus locisalis]SFU14235.1 PAS domain S-box-containing protein [Algoriphagus locisalis]
MLPEHERDALIEKQQLLEKIQELGIDQLTKSIANQFGVLGATLSIVTENRVWFKSKYGILINEIEPDQSLSRELLKSGNKHLIIEHLSGDEIYCNHPLHTIYGLEFFAAAQLYLEDSLPFGVLCVFGTEPLKPNQKQLKALSSTADQIGQLIKNELTEREELAHDFGKESFIIKKTSPVEEFGGFYANTATNELQWNPENNRILNIKKDWTPKFHDLVNPIFCKHFNANNGVLKLINDIKKLIDNPEISRHSKLYQLNFSLPKIHHIHMIYHRSGDAIFVVLKDETNFLELAEQDNQKKVFIQEVESLSGIGGWQFELAKQNVKFTGNACKILNIAPKPAFSLPFLHLNKRVKEYDELKNGIKQALESKKMYSGDYEYILGKTLNKTVRIKAKPIFINQKCERLVGTIQDITEDKANLDMLSLLKADVQQQVDFYKSLVNNSHVFIFQLAPDGELMYSNKQFRSVFGTNEPSGKDPYENELLKYQPKNRVKIQKVIQECLQSPGSSFPIMLDRKDTSGKNRITRWDCSTIGDSAGKAPGILFIGVDITELQESKEKLLGLLDEITLHNEQLVELSEVLNHNVRSQVANLQGLLNLMGLMKTAEEKMDYFNYLDQTVQNLNEITAIVSSVLHIQNNKNLEYEEVNLQDLVDALIMEFIEDILSHSIVVAIDIPVENPIVSVKRYLHFVLRELISNAIRFRKMTEPLHLSIAMRRASGKVNITVSDNGKGIDMAIHKDSIFKLYQTLDATPKHKGTGLYLSKMRVLALGGSIHLESTSGQGSTFVIELPDEKN